MATSVRELVQQRPDDGVEAPPVFPKKLWVVMAACWMQLLVLIFVGGQVARHVRTPLHQWGQKLVQVLTTR